MIPTKKLEDSTLKLNYLDLFYTWNLDCNTICQLAIIMGDLDILRSQDQEDLDIQQAISLAIITQQNEILKYLQQKQNISMNDVELGPVLTSYEKLQKYLQRFYPDANETLPIIGITANIKTLRTLKQKNIDVKNIIPFATMYGRIDILLYLEQQEINISSAMFFAAAFGQLEVLHFFHQKNIGIGIALPLAVATGKTEVLDFFYENKLSVKEALPWAMLKGKATIIKYLHEHNHIDPVLSKESIIRLDAMNQEILGSDPIYHPSNFWNTIGDSQKAHLYFGGEANFKRTINQSYCNFIPNSPEDPLIAHLEKHLSHIEISPSDYTLENPDNDPNLWFSFYSQYQIFRGNRENKNLYLYFVSKIYEHTNNSKMKILDTLEEPTLGNPIKLYKNGKLISQDLVTSVNEFSQIIQYFDTKKDERLTIGELGAGYGRLAYVFLKNTCCRYMIFDIPPALHIAEWYLSTLFPEKRVFKFRHFDKYQDIEAELTESSIAFFTPNQLALFPPQYFDVFVNISSLHEMSRAQIKHFTKTMSYVTKKIIYIKQYWKYLNHIDNLCITDAEYIFPPAFKVQEKKQDILNPLFFEMVMARNTPTISILLSNYNHAHYLPESLSALCEQTVPAFEIIIIDDGSTDNSIQIIEEFKKKYHNITILHNEKNEGLLFSINRALNEARGDYIVWASADDRLLPNFIETNLKYLELYPHAALCFSKLAVLEEDTGNIRYYKKENQGLAYDLEQEAHYLSPEDLKLRLQKSYLWMSGNTVVAQRSYILEIGGFHKELRWHADWFTFYAIALQQGACVIPETLALIRERPNTYSQTGMRNLKEQYQVLKSLLNILYNRKNKNLRDIFIKCPCLLSPFEYPMLIVFAKNLQYWKLGKKFLYWYLFDHHKYHIRLLNKLKRGIIIIISKLKTIAIKIKFYIIDLLYLFKKALVYAKDAWK